MSMAMVRPILAIGQDHSLDWSPGLYMSEKRSIELEFAFSSLYFLMVDEKHFNLLPPQVLHVVMD